MNIFLFTQTFYFAKAKKDFNFFFWLFPHTKRDAKLFLFLIEKKNILAQGGGVQAMIYHSYSIILIPFVSGMISWMIIENTDSSSTFKQNKCKLSGILFHSFELSLLVYWAIYGLIYSVIVLSEQLHQMITIHQEDRALNSLEDWCWQFTYLASAIAVGIVIKNKQHFN